MSIYSKMGKIVPALVALFFLVAAGVSSGLALEPAKGKPILRISGQITEVNAGDQAVFDIKMLENLGATSFTTKTPWFDDPITFEGVLLRKILAAVGAKGKSITVVALNDYRATLPVEDFDKFDVILAYKRDGSYMKIRDKGPLFIVYPFDSNTDLQRQLYYGRSVWQVARIIVL